MSEATIQPESNSIGNAKITAIAGLLAILAVTSLIPSYLPRLTELASEMTMPGIGSVLANSDFVNYWFAGKLAWRGEEMILFDPQAYYQLLQSSFGVDFAPHIWSYPPHALLIFLPLAFTSYKAGLVLFLVLTLAFYATAAYQFHKRYSQFRYLPIFIVAHIGFVVTNLVATQNGFLTGGLLLYFLSYYDRRPVLAAICLAFLTIKPQLGILIPFMLAYARCWNVMILAAVFSIVLVGVSVLVFGFDPWREYWVSVLPIQSSVLSEWRGSFVMMMPTFFAALRILGWDSGSALLGHLVFALLCVPVALMAIARARSQLEMAFVLLLSTFCITPYAFNYDMGALVTISALFLLQMQGTMRTVGILSGVLCLTPVWVYLLASASIPLVPIILLVTLLALSMQPSSETRIGTSAHPVVG